MKQSGQETVVATIEGRTGRLLLDRPKALNALSHDLIAALTERLVAWRDDPAVAQVLIEGAGGKAFSAGADVRAVHAMRGEGDMAGVRAYFADEYALDLLVATYPKPIICLVDGLCLGGGMGLAVAASDCVATEKASFAMPETLIGFFPDAGATWFLPCLPGRLGLYLGLTGERLSGGDAVHLGLARHFVPSAALGDLVAALTIEGVSAIARFSAPPPPFSLADRLEAIDTAFGAGSVAGIVARLAADGSAWALATRENLAARSPAALARGLDLLTHPGSGLAECLANELDASEAAIGHPDFAEGVRAALIDKDKAPRWQS